MMFHEKIATIKIYSELEIGNELSVKVDHLDDYKSFQFDTDIKSMWMTREDLMEIKRVINKALRIHKHGFNKVKYEPGI